MTLGHYKLDNSFPSTTLTYQGRRKQFLCGQAKSSQCVLGSGMCKHTETRGVWEHAPPGKFLKFTVSETASGSF